jgi:D-aminoacyl-tRNA deacylase
MIAIVFAADNIASMNLFDRFLERGFKETDRAFQGAPIFEKDDLILARCKQHICYLEQLDDLNAEQIIVASSHKSEAGTPSFTIHHTGNFGPNELGGNERQLSFANAPLMKSIYMKMLENPFPDYVVCLEQTHHGPTEFRTPLCFVELGSSEKQWRDEKAAAFLADCILNGLKITEQAEAVIGVGGNHYASLFSELEKELAFGHMCPKYALDYLDEAMAREMIEKTIPTPSKVIFDEKGVKQKTRLKELFKDYEVILR